MIPLGLDAIETLGRLQARPWVDEVTGVQIDSRRIDEGDLFVAVGAGGDFAAHALARGAAAVLVPDDDHVALAAIGGAVRNRSRARVVGITGATGKTTTKDILAALCAPHRRTVASEGNFNNELGVPLTLCRLEPDTEVCIVEMGMRGLGQIAWLASFARPDVGLITNIAPVHLELVETVENVARAKAELIEALPPGGVAVVPEEPLLEPYLTRSDITVRRFGRVDEPGRFAVGGRTISLQTSYAARHQLDNTLAALTVCDVLGIPLEDGTLEVAFSPLAGGGAGARGRHRPAQRLLQREPDLDAGGAGAPCRARGRPAADRGARRDGGARPGRGGVPSRGRRGRRGRRCRASSSPSGRSRASTGPARPASGCTRSARPPRRWSASAGCCARATSCS